METYNYLNKKSNTFGYRLIFTVIFHLAILELDVKTI